MSFCERHCLPRTNDDGDTYNPDLSIEPSNGAGSRHLLAERLARTKRQLASDVAHLRKLRTNHQRTSRSWRGQIAYEQSRLLLDRIDGLSSSSPLNEILFDD
jgi:hypothetical protein